MVYKLITLIFFININIGLSNIIYDKNDIIITDIEINNYFKIYKSSFGISISKNKAIKDLVLSKKTINYLLKYNLKYISSLDQKILSEMGQEVINDKSLLNFMRFQRIRNEFISEYFQNEFNVDDLKIIFSSFGNLEIPLSKNNCLTIEKLYSINSDDFFINNFYENLKNNQRKFTTIINDELFGVCINNKLFRNIENEIIKYIEIKTKNKFDNFIYEKAN